ncbi:hypothetical protein Trydic_g15151 [Trypoxylus dichotomus]
MEGCFLIWKWTLFATLLSSSLSENFRLIILHNHDMHSRFPKQKGGWGGFPRTAHYINERRKEAAEDKSPPVIYLNAGDTFTGSIWFSVHRWVIAAAFMKALRPDVLSLGNHEYDDGIDDMCNFVRYCGSPVVCANCNFSREPEAYKLVKPSHILTVKDRRIGIIGYLTTETRLEARPGETVFEDEVESVQKEAQRLTKEGIDIIIALGHAGFDIDREIAHKVPEVDVVVGGHTNTFLWHANFSTVPSSEKPEGHYPTMIERPGKPPCPVVQAYAYTKYIGHLSLVFDENGNLIHSDGEDSYVVFLNKSFKEDPKVVRLLNQFRPQIDLMSKNVIGETDVDLHADLCRKEECALANMVTDAFIDYKASLYNETKGWTDTPIAILNGGALRMDILQGPITQSDIFTTLPFFQKLVSFEIYGHQIKKTLETGVRRELSKVEGEFIQVSGIHYTFDRHRPVGHRVINIMMRCAECDCPMYEPIDYSKLYRIITIIFLANGGDGHSTLKNRINSEIEIAYDTDVVHKYLDYNDNVRPERHIMKDIILAVFSVISSFCLVLFLVALGWYIVWKLFLSRFKFIRELIGGMSENSSVADLKNERNKVRKSRRD